MNSFLHLPVFAPIEATKMCKIMSWLFSIVAVGSVCGFLHGVGSLYLPMCGVCLIYVLLGGLRFGNKLYLLLYLAFGISAMFATEPLFNSKVRFLLFVAVTLVCSPCLVTERAVKFRALVLRNILSLLIFLSIGSFFCYFLGINFMSRGSDEMFAVNEAGTFGGLFSHSMLLGPFAAFVTLVFMNCYLAHKKKIFIILFFISTAAVVMSASRAAIMALVVPVLYSIIFAKGVGRLRKGIIVLLVASAMLSVPIADRISTGLVEKQQNSYDAGSVFSSREGKWENRIAEFKESPIVGVGFCAVSLDSTGDYSATGGVEPGSAYLAVLSMTGLLGIIPYLLVLFSAYKCVRREETEVARLRMCLLLAGLVHTFAEGYTLHAGSQMFLVFWLILSQCEDYPLVKEELENNDIEQ